MLSLSAISVAACYVGLPAAVALKARVAPRPVRRGSVALPDRVSVVVAAHNEAASIIQKLDDLSAQRLGDVELEIVIASDGSSDATVELAQAHPAQPVVLDLPRGGKATALNAGIERSSGDIIVFTDANSGLDDSTLATLLDPFTDPEVGGVAGDQRYRRSTSGAGEGERSYWDYERALKRWESAAGNVVSSTGALHAVRRQFVEEVPGDVTDDFFLSTGVIVNGGRLVFEPDAMAWEEPGEKGGDEYRRKVRIITRGLTAIRRRKSLLNPLRHGGYSLVLLMHKVARRLMFVPLVGAFAATIVLRRESRVAAWALRGQAALYGAGAIGVITSESPVGRLPVFSLPGHFVRTYAAAAHAVGKVLRSERIVSWEHQRPS